MKNKLKIKLIVPNQIKLVGTVLDVCVDNDMLVGNTVGTYSSFNDRIVLSSDLKDQAKFRCFCHELSEAIAYLCVNESDNGGDKDVPHEVRDGYGQGIFNFLVDNIQNILAVDDDCKD